MNGRGRGRTKVSEASEGESRVLWNAEATFLAPVLDSFIAYVTESGSTFLAVVTLSAAPTQTVLATPTLRLLLIAHSAVSQS
jgi:hypothetical protein